MISVSSQTARPVGGGDDALQWGKVLKPRVFFGGADRNIKVMSYNCRRFFRNENGELMKPQSKVADVAKIIRAENPDILCLQEVGDPALLNEFNRRYLGGRYANVISTGKPGEAGSQLAILAKPEFQLRGESVIVPRGPELSHPMMMVTFTDSRGRNTTVANAHFKAPRPNLVVTADKRLKEAQIARAMVQERMVAHPDEDIILAGDLNSPYDRPMGRAVTQTLAGLPVDLKAPIMPEAIRQGMLVEPFLARSRALPDKGVDTHRLKSFRGKLDYIWVTPGLYDRVQTARVVGSFRNRFFRKTSDHLPITVVYSPKPVVAQARFGGRLNRIA